MRRTGHIRERSPGSFELRYWLGTDTSHRQAQTATATVRGTRKDARGNYAGCSAPLTPASMSTRTGSLFESG